MEGTMVEQAGMRQLAPQERRRVEQIDQRLDKALQAALDADPELRRQFERTYPRRPRHDFDIDDEARWVDELMGLDN